jgi:hypothetical protein
MKPSNIMISSDDQVLLMDFGIARPSTPAGQQRTIAGAVVGTTAYMAPEQARGEAVDQRTDVYSFGLVLYEMLCGIRDDMTIAELLARMKAAPPSARQRNPGVPADLDAVVMRCLKPAAADRYQTSADVAAALSGFSRSRRGAAASGAWKEWASRAAVAALVLALLAGLVYWWRTPSASTLRARASAVVTQSVGRLSALDPVALLARESPATPEVESEAAAVAQAATARTAAGSVNAERARAEAGDAARGESYDTRRAAYAPRLQLDVVEPAMTRAGVSTVTPRPQFDDARHRERAMPSIEYALARRSPMSSPARAVPTQAPWSTERRPDASPFVAPIEADSRAPIPETGSEQPLAVAQVLRAAADTSGSWLDRVLSRAAYVKTDRYADPIEEFQVCHVPRQ